MNKVYYEKHKTELSMTQKSRYDRRKHEGRCPTCGRILGHENTVLCSQCKLKERIYYQKCRGKLIQAASLRRSVTHGTASLARTGVCSLCGDAGGSTIRHHIILREAGGSDCSENLVELCKKHHLEYARLTMKLMIKHLLTLYGEEELRNWIKSSM